MSHTSLRPMTILRLLNPNCIGIIILSEWASWHLVHVEELRIRIIHHTFLSFAFIGFLSLRIHQIYHFDWWGRCMHYLWLRLLLWLKLTSEISITLRFRETILHLESWCLSTEIWNFLMPILILGSLWEVRQRHLSMICTCAIMAHRAIRILH